MAVGGNHAADGPFACLVGVLIAGRLRPVLAAKEFLDWGAQALIGIKIPSGS